MGEKRLQEAVENSLDSFDNERNKVDKRDCTDKKHFVDKFCVESEQNE